MRVGRNRTGDVERRRGLFKSHGEIGRRLDHSLDEKGRGGMLMRQPHTAAHSPGN